MKRAFAFVVPSVLAAMILASVAVAANGAGPDQPPVNDLIELATDLTGLELPTSDRVDATLATAGAGEPAHGTSAAAASVWWRWTATVSEDMVVSSAGSNVATTLVVYEDGPSLTQVVAGVGTVATGSTLQFTATADTTYFFVIDQKGPLSTATGEVEFTLRFEGPVPLNDDFATPSLLSGRSVSFGENSALATAEVDEPDHAGEPAAKSLWWEWTAPATGLATMTTCGTVFDTLVSVSTGDALDSLVTVAENDDADPPLSCDLEGFGLSRVQFVASGGETYNIAVDGFVGSAGPMLANLSLRHPGLYVWDQPCVVFDSMTAGQQPMVGGEQRDVFVAGPPSGSLCVPSGVSSIVFRVSAIDPQTEGNLRMWATGADVSGGAGVVNYGANGLNNANTVVVPVSSSGSVTVEANAGLLVGSPTTHFRLAVVGYYSPLIEPDLKFFPLNPCAVADSRPNKGADSTFDGPNGDGLWPVGGSFPDIDVVGAFSGGQGGLNGVGGVSGITDCGVPVGADSVMVNVVAVGPVGGSGHLSVGTGGTNPVDEPTTPFTVLTPGMANGTTTIVNLNGQDSIAVDIDGDVGASTKVRVEVLGYFANGDAGLDYTEVTPCTAFDSRENKGATGAFAGLRTHGPNNATIYQVAGDEIPIGQGKVDPVAPDLTTGDCGVPDDASAVLMNFEAVNAVREGNFWVSAGDQTTTGGVLNFNDLTPKMNNANAVVVPLDANGQIRVEINAGSFTAIGTEVAHARGIVLGYYG